MAPMSRRRPAQKQLTQPRVSGVVDQHRPARWDWAAVIAPLDRRVARGAPDTLNRATIRNLRYFWLDGLFAAISENFYLGFVALYALYYGANNAQVGWVTAVANLLGAAAFFPGARLAERTIRRKRLVLWSGGGLARVMLAALAMFPFLVSQPRLAIVAIIVFNGLRAFFSNLGNPAWTGIVADIVPQSMRGRYFSLRNIAMGVAALLVAPLAGLIIRRGNLLGAGEPVGYQLVFALAFVFGMAATASFRRLREPAVVVDESSAHHRGDLRRALRASPAFVGFVVSAFVFNLALQVAAPFLNVYVVRVLGASTSVVGILAAISSTTALFGQRLFGRLLDERGATWVLLATGFVIPILPLAYLIITAPWQVGVNNILGGFVWAGYNLANFNLLLALTPEEGRPRAVALYQTAVFSSAVLGPLLGGWLADVYGYDIIFVISGLGRWAGMLLFLWLVARRLRRAP